LLDIWVAFWTLSNSRAVGFGAVGFVPVTEIEAYARIYQIDDVQLFLHYIRSMDVLYVKTTNARLSKK
jgi:hypothetical protein